MIVSVLERNNIRPSELANCAVSDIIGASVSEPLHWWCQWPSVSLRLYVLLLRMRRVTWLVFVMERQRRLNDVATGNRNGIDVRPKTKPPKPYPEHFCSRCLMSNTEIRVSSPQNYLLVYCSECALTWISHSRSPHNAMHCQKYRWHELGIIGASMSEPLHRWCQLVSVSDHVRPLFAHAWNHVFMDSWMTKTKPKPGNGIEDRTYEAIPLEHFCILCQWVHIWAMLKFVYGHHKTLFLNPHNWLTRAPQWEVPNAIMISTSSWLSHLVLISENEFAESVMSVLKKH